MMINQMEQDISTSLIYNLPITAKQPFARFRDILKYIRLSGYRYWWIEQNGDQPSAWFYFYSNVRLLWASRRIRKIEACACAGDAGNVFHVTHVPWCMSGSLTSGFLWSRWRGERSRHSQHMRNPQFNVSRKRPMKCTKAVIDCRDDRCICAMQQWCIPVCFACLVLLWWVKCIMVHLASG